MIRLSNYIDERLVLFLDSATKEEVLKQLVDLSATVKELPAKDRFYQAILLETLRHVRYNYFVAGVVEWQTQGT